MDKNPYVWLQPTEKQAKLSCGCRLVADYEGKGAAFFMCKEHRNNGR